MNLSQLPLLDEAIIKKENKMMVPNCVSPAKHIFITANITKL